MFSRRNFLKSVSASTLAGGSGSTAAMQLVSNNNLDSSREAGRREPPINVARALRVMEEEELDALVVTRPINFYHFTGYVDHMSLRMDSPTSFAIICRDPQRPSAVIMNQFIYYYSVVDNDFDWGYSVNLFSGWAGSATEDVEGVSSSRTAAAPFILSLKMQLPRETLKRLGCANYKPLWRRHHHMGIQRMLWLT